MRHSLPVKIRRIAVLRANAIGDLVFSLPALAALKQRFPGAELVLLGSAWHKRFLRNRSEIVDRVIALPLIRGLQHQDKGLDFAQGIKFFRGLRKERFDIVFQMHGGGKYSNAYVGETNSYTVGLKTPDAPSLDRNVPYVYYQNEIMRLLEVARYAGASTPDPEPRMTAHSSDIGKAQEVADMRVPFVVIHPGSSERRRIWSAEGFADAAGYLCRMGYRVYVTGSQSETRAARAVAAGSGTPESVTDLSGSLDLDGMVGLLSGASLVLSNDTGPLHLANALGVPTVGIYWCANVITAAPPFRTNRRIVVSWETRCPVCHADVTRSGYPFDRRNGCPHDTSFVSGISAGEVKASIDELLSPVTRTLFSGAQSTSHTAPVSA